MISYYSIDDNYYQIIFTKNRLTIWKHSDVTNNHGFWIYTASAKIKHGNLDHNWSRSVPIELKKFCEKILTNKVFW